MTTTQPTDLDFDLETTSDSPVGESEASEFSFTSWGDDLTEGTVKSFGGHVGYQLRWEQRIGLDRAKDVTYDPPDDGQEKALHYGFLDFQSQMYSGFKKCFEANRFKLHTHNATKKESKGAAKVKQPISTYCRTPGCAGCWMHHVSTDVSAIKRAFDTFLAAHGSEATFEIRYATVPANFILTSDREGKTRCLDAVTGVRHQATINGKRVRYRKLVLWVQSLDAPTEAEIAELLELNGGYASDYPLVKRLVSINVTPFNRECKFESELKKSGFKETFLKRVVGRDGEYAVGDKDGGVNACIEHPTLVSQYDPKKPIEELAPSGKGTGRKAYVHSIIVDNNGKDTDFQPIVEAYLYLNPYPLNVNRVMRTMEEGAPEAFMRKVKVMGAKTRWLDTDFDVHGCNVRAMKAAQRETRLAADPKAADPANFNKKLPDKEQQAKRTAYRSRARLIELDYLENGLAHDIRANREKAEAEEAARVAAERAARHSPEATGDRYIAQLNSFKTFRGSFTVDQLLHDQHLHFTPLFRYAMAVFHKQADVQKETADMARLELEEYPHAQQLFTDLLLGLFSTR